MKKSLCLLLLALSALLLNANQLTPRKRYRADFEIRTIGQAYPLDWFCQNLKFDYPGVSFRFANAKGKEIKVTGKSPFFVAFSEKFVPGSFEFYAPDGAVKLVLRKSRVIVRNLKITEVPIGKDLALPTDYRITGPARSAVISINPDKTVIFDTSVNGVIECLPIPVEPGQRYKLTVYGATGSRMGKSSSLLIRYYFYKSSLDSKSISSNKERLSAGKRNKPLVYEITTPKNAGWFTIWCMWAKFISYKLEKI